MNEFSLRSLRLGGKYFSKQKGLIYELSCTDYFNASRFRYAPIWKKVGLIGTTQPACRRFALLTAGKSDMVLIIFVP
jgi:hypothetical protein